MALVERIQSIVANGLGDNDHAWVRFVKDHRDWLIQRSTTIVISASDAHVYKYRPAEWIKYTQRLDPQLTWVFLWLNQLQNSAEFATQREYLVPTMDTMRELRTMYNNHVRALTAADAKLYARR